MSWNRVRSIVRAAHAAIESEPKHLAPIRPLAEEALELLNERQTINSKADLQYLLTKIQEFVIQWRPSPRPTPGVLYMQPAWAKSTDKHIGEALELLNVLPDSAITETAGAPVHSEKESTMKIFVSHSTSDTSVAEAFVHMARTALNIPSKDIRCTSVGGYKLSTGASSDDQLREEIFDCEVFVALLSPSSMKSTYVMFELGARWGSKKYLAPIMVAGVTVSDLKPPLSGIHSISGTSEPDLHQLINDIGTHLNISSDSPAAYSKALHEFIAKS